MSISASSRADAAGPRERPRQPRRRAPYRTELWLMLAPFLIGAAALVAVPALLSVGLSFTLYDGVSPPRWNAMRNFAAMTVEPRALAAIQNSIAFIFMAAPLRVLGALALALLLRQRRRGVGLFRAAVYLPTVVPDVAYALVWLWIFNPFYGPLNLALAGLGLPTPAWLVQAETAKPALAFMALFQIGEGFVLLLAGLHAISQDYYDSAAVDGAARWQQFAYITLPLLVPWLVLLSVRDVIFTFQSTFVPAFIMTNGDPYYATLFLPLLVYKEAFDSFRLGQASAHMLVLLLTTAALVGGLLAVFRGWLHGDER